MSHVIWIRKNCHDSCATAYTVEEFEALLRVTYAPQLVFARDKDYQTVKQQCDKLTDTNRVSSDQLWLGEYYREQISAGFIAPVEIRYIDSVMGYGLFARSPLAKGAYVASYTGVVIRRRYFSLIPNHYLYLYPTSLFFWREFLIDAKKKGNESRFINHSYQHANVEAMPAFCDDWFHVLMIAKSDIAEGEQLLVNYGAEYWARRKVR